MAGRSLIASVALADALVGTAAPARAGSGVGESVPRSRCSTAPAATTRTSSIVADTRRVFRIRNRRAAGGATASGRTGDSRLPRPSRPTACSSTGPEIPFSA
jgi:hypothetical protein